MSLLLALAAAASGADDQAQTVYFACVKSTAQRYATSRESAEAIADATLAKCSDQAGDVRDATMAYLRGKGIRGDRATQAWTDQIEPHLREKARGEALQYVIEARLHQAPPTRSPQPGKRRR